MTNIIPRFMLTKSEVDGEDGYFYEFASDKGTCVEKILIWEKAHNSYHVVVYFPKDTNTDIICKILQITRISWYPSPLNKFFAHYRENRSLLEKLKPFIAIEYSQIYNSLVQKIEKAFAKSKREEIDDDSLFFGDFDQ